LHNYRIFCAGATITRNGKTCTDCLDGSPYQAVLHGCYRNSRIGSLVVARMIDSHRRRRTWQTKVDSFIVLSEMAKAYFTRLGIASDKISIIHNFARELSPDLVGIWRAPAPDRPTGLFVGRLTTNKGLDLLINAVQGLDVRLTIIGDGPLQEMVREAERGGQVSWLGQQPPEVVAAHMQSADFLIFPSVDVEGQPLVIIEACRSGLPTICSGCDPRGEFLEDGRNCLTFSRGDVGQLRQRINELAASSALRALLSQGARETYQQLFSEGAHYCKLIALYQTIIMQRQGLGS
jgi:glycosyltransferase involved in cell wall biosynthesis